MDRPNRSVGLLASAFVAAAGLCAPLAALVGPAAPASAQVTQVEPYYVVVRESNVNLRCGAGVCLVPGVTSLPTPHGAERIDVGTALEMRDAVMAELSRATIVIKAAAVADFRPAQVSGRKIKKEIDRLPPKRLESLAEYVQFLNRPPLVDRLASAEKAIASGKGVNWRKVRSDV